MEAAAHRLAGSSDALKDPLGLNPNPRLGFRSSGRLPGKAVSGAPTSSGSRWHCAAPVVPRKKNNLLAVSEQHFLRAVEHPLEGLTFSREDFAAALSKYDYNFEVGNTVKGVVFLTDKTGALIDIGAKAPALMPTAEVSLLQLKNVEEVGLFAGCKDEFHVLREDDANGRLILSLKKIQCDLAWERCRQLQAEDAVINCLVLSINSGGLLVDVEGLRGFVPLSCVASKTPLEQLIDKVIPLKFMGVDEDQGRLVLNNKKALMVHMSDLGIGTIVEGVVVSVKPYGAFIDIGGRSGLLHISQISHERVEDVKDVLQPGDKLKVMVVKEDKDRISLSTKKLEPKPGDMLRNPSHVYSSAEEMGRLFRRRIAQAEAAGAKDKELGGKQEGSQLDTDQGSLSSALHDFALGPSTATKEA